MLSDETLKRYFLEELENLRTESVRFASDYPEVAEELLLNGERSGDPQIEMMLQSFAYLTGNLRYQMDLDDALLPNQLLASLSPHLEAPWPAASIVQFAVTQGNFASVQCVKRDTPLSSNIDLHGKRYPCRFITRYDTEVWPIEDPCVTTPQLSLIPTVKPGGDAVAALSVKLRTHEGFRFDGLPIQRLSFYLNGVDRFRLSDQLRNNLLRVIVRNPVDDSYYQLPSSALSFKGLAVEDSLLPGDAGVNPGLPLLREYFLFPDKFLFGTVEGLTTKGFERELDIIFLLSQECATPTNDAFKVNCAPVINLFRQAIEPIHLRATRLEYQVTGDQFNHAHNEIHSLGEIYAQRPDGTTEALQPLYGDRDSPFGYWVARREPSQLASVVGTEYFLRFLNQAFEPEWQSGTNVMGRALCTNRDLPERLPLNAHLQLDAPGVVQTATMLRRPSRHQTPQLAGDQTRRLVMQLNSQYLPLSGPNALKTLRQLLEQHLPADQAGVRRQIDALLSLRCRMVGHHVGDDAWRGYCHGTELTLIINVHCFDHASVILFGEVLNECLAHFVPLNSFVKLVLIGANEEPIRCWPARVGVQCLL
jgi:type VI secretion system protein ImpG